MKHTTLGMLAGAVTGASGIGLLYSGVQNTNTAALAKVPAPPGARVKEVLGAALIIGGVGLALGSGVKALAR